VTWVCPGCDTCPGDAYVSPEIIPFCCCQEVDGGYHCDNCPIKVADRRALSYVTEWAAPFQNNREECSHGNAASSPPPLSRNLEAKEEQEVESEKEEHPEK